ncbi:transposase family protein [Streptomyces sp. NPDC007818]|uniref:helix-turn-helix domain-containing protein n=1 Tax=Streptomyces sp. NPDC007818 TaxID=3364780 RepID=UPI0036BE98B5
MLFADRLVATLIHLRHDLPHSVLALLFGVDRSTVTRAVREIRALLSRTSSLRRPEITAPTGGTEGRAEGGRTSHGSGTGHPAARSPHASGPGPGSRIQPRC